MLAGLQGQQTPALQASVSFHAMVCTAFEGYQLGYTLRKPIPLECRLHCTTELRLVMPNPCNAIGFSAPLYTACIDVCLLHLRDVL